ncbi:sulfotransferase, partial [Chloroflexota bacterium]
MVARFLRRINLATQVLISGKITAGKRDAIPAITKEEVTEAKLFFPMEKFFIFGHARSGTTLLARLVRKHPEVHCNYQAHFFTRPPLLQDLVINQEVGKWLTRSSNRWNRGRDLSPVVMRAVSDFILERDARQVGKNMVGDKSPNSLLNGEAVQLLFNIYPDANLVFIVRDGRDAVLSHRFQSFIDNPQHLTKEDEHIYESFIKNPQPFLDGEHSLFTEKGITQATEGWVHNVVETDYWGRELFGERFFTMRFEDLLKHPWNEMDRLWSFLGVKTDITDLDDTV